MDTKKLIKLYEEYRKIGQPKEYNKGGSVSKEHDKNNLKRLEKAFDMFVEEEGKEKSKGYADGGEVKDASEEQGSFFDSVRKAFSTPVPKAAQPEENKYDKIRRENSERVSGKRPSLGSMDSSTQNFADGGEVQSDPITGNIDPNSPEGLAMIQQASYPEAKRSSEEPADVEGDEQLISAKQSEKPAKDLEEESVDDKAVEDPYKDEQLEAEMKADEDKSNSKVANKDDESDREPASEESSDKEKQDIKDGGFSGKAEGVESPNFSSQSLAEAQKQRDLNNAYAQIERGAAIAGAGLGGRAKIDPSQTLKEIDKQQALAGMPVQKYSEQLANQPNDPNSPVSKVVGDYLVKKGFNLPPGTSAADAFKVMPFLSKDQALQNAIQKVMMQTQSRESIASDNRDAANKRAADRNAIEQQKANAAMENAKNNKETKAIAGQDRALAQTKTMLESARGNPAAAQAEKDMYAVDKVNSLLKIYPDPNKMPQAQVNLLISEIGKIATGGVPTGHETEALKPNSAEGKLQSLYGQLTNSPTPANAGAYLKEFQKYNKSLESDAQKVIKDKYGRVIESSKKQLGDDNYKALHDQYLSRFDKKEQSAGAHPQDSKAIEWAKANMKDPRAAQILKANGM